MNPAPPVMRMFKMSPFRPLRGRYSQSGQNDVCHHAGLVRSEDVREHEVRFATPVGGGRPSLADFGIHRRIEPKTKAPARTESQAEFPGFAGSHLDSRSEVHAASDGVRTSALETVFQAPASV